MYVLHQAFHIQGYLRMSAEFCTATIPPPSPCADIEYPKGVGGAMPPGPTPTHLNGKMVDGYFLQ